MTDTATLQQWADDEIEPSDAIAEALASLREWDRQCREAHQQHMAELAECRAAFEEAML